MTAIRNIACAVFLFVLIAGGVNASLLPAGQTFTDLTNDSGRLTTNWTISSGSVTQIEDPTVGSIYAMNGGITFQDNTSVSNVIVTFKSNNTMSQRLLVKMEWINTSNYIFADIGVLTGVARIYEYRSGVLSPYTGSSVMNWTPGYHTWRIEHERDHTMGIYLDDILITASSNLTSAQVGSILIQSTSLVGIQNITISNAVTDKWLLPGSFVYTSYDNYPHITKTTDANGSYWELSPYDVGSTGMKKLCYTILPKTVYTTIPAPGASQILVNLSAESIYETADVPVVSPAEWWMAFSTHSGNIYFARINQTAPIGINGSLVTIASTIGADQPYSPKITYYNGKYIVMYSRPYNVTLSPAIYQRTSTDGTTWTSEALVTDKLVGGPDPVIINSTLHVFVGSDATHTTPSGNISYITSTDGTTYSDPVIAIPDPLLNDGDPDVIVHPVSGIPYMIYGFQEQPPYQYANASFMHANGTWANPVKMIPDLNSSRINNSWQIYRASHVGIGDDPEIYYDANRDALGIHSVGFIDYDYTTSLADNTSLPEAGFTCTPVIQTLGSSIACTDTSTFDPTGWTWYWNDGGNTSATQNPTYTYANNGTHSVNLSVSNPEGSTWYNRSNYITITDIPTGFTQQDIWQTGQYVQTFHVTDASTGAAIPVVTITDSSGQTYTTTNGTGYLTEGAGAIVVYFASTGYTGIARSYIVDEDASHTVQMTAATTSTTSTWYTPHQVRFAVMDSREAKVVGATVNATAISSTFPTDGTADWLIDMYGIDPDAANDMLNGTLIMHGTTQSDGATVFTMHSSIGYSLAVTNPSNGVIQTVNVTPIDTIYIIHLLGTVANNTYMDMGYNTSLYVTEPDIHNVTMNLRYQDMSARTTLLEFFVLARVNNTVINYQSTSSIGSNIILMNYTVPNIRPDRYSWYYNAVRVK